MMAAGTRHTVSDLRYCLDGIGEVTVQPSHLNSIKKVIVKMLIFYPADPVLYPRDWQLLPRDGGLSCFYLQDCGYFSINQPEMQHSGLC